MKKFIVPLLVLEIIWSQNFKSEPMILSNGKEIIKIKPNDILKINGKEAYYNGLDISSRKANFILNDDNQSKSYSFDEIKKIHLEKDGLFFKQISNYASVGFNRGLYVSKVLSAIGSLFLLKFKDRGESHEEWQLTKSETSFIYFVILTPFVSGVVGGIVGIIKPNIIFDDPIYLEKNGWNIIN